MLMMCSPQVRQLIGIVLLIAVLSPAVMGASTAGDPALDKKLAGKHFDRVIIVVLENQNYTSAAADPFLRYAATKGVAFENFKGLFHPSYPNYLAMIAGNSFGITSDTQVEFPDDAQHRTIANFLDWKNYAENYPGTSEKPFLGDDHKKRYMRKHVPFLSFKKIRVLGFENVVSVNPSEDDNQFTRDVAGCRAHIEDCPLARYTFYTPNLDDDGHDPVLRPKTGLRKASAWLKAFLTTQLSVFDSPLQKTLVIVTFDESEGREKSNRIYTVFLGDVVRPGIVKEPYTHYDVLRTVEDNFNVQPFGVGDQKGSVIQNIWNKN